MNVQVIDVWWWVFGSRSAFKVTPEVFSCLSADQSSSSTLTESSFLFDLVLYTLTHIYMCVYKARIKEKWWFSQCFLCWADWRLRCTLIISIVESLIHWVRWTLNRSASQINKWLMNVWLIWSKQTDSGFTSLNESMIQQWRLSRYILNVSLLNTKIIFEFEFVPLETFNYC